MSASPVLSLRKFSVPEFVLGTGASSLAGSYARRFGATRIMLVSDEGLLKTAHVDAVLATLVANELDPVLFTAISPNPREGEVREGSRFYREHQCDAIVALGGGSVMDCAKGIGLMATNDRDVLEFEGVDNVPLPGPPLLCIPTTAGTAADISQFAVISSATRGTKFIIASKKAIPDVSLVDPELCVSMPADLTAATGMDALVHAIEAYVSTASSPVTDLNALKAISLVAEYLPRAVRDGEDREARNGMTLASLLAGFAFSNASLGAVHSLAHPLGGQLDLPHGLCNALLLEAVIAYNFESAALRYGDVVEALLAGFSRGQGGRLPDRHAPPVLALVDLIHSLRSDINLGFGLSAYGLTSELIPGLAVKAYLDAALATNPRKPSVSDLEELYAAAL